MRLSFGVFFGSIGKSVNGGVVNKMGKECKKCGLPPDLCICEDIELEEDRMRRMKVKSIRIQGKYKGRGKQRNREA